MEDMNFLGILNVLDDTGQKESWQTGKIGVNIMTRKFTGIIKGLVFDCNRLMTIRAPWFRAQTPELSGFRLWHFSRAV